MFAIFQRFLDWLRSLFWKEELELTLVGLQYSGKTTFVSVIAVSIILQFLCIKLNCVFQVWPIFRGHDSNCWFQHEKGY